jgi:hypothetical protein
MRSSVFVPVAALAAQALAQNATAVTGNPKGAVYTATLSDMGDGIKGYISGMTAPNGNSVIFTVHFENIPSEGGPFGYHLHAAPAVNGNCTSTKAHLDPSGRGQEPPCNKDFPNSCEVGDLSGKYGKIPAEGGSFDATFIDTWASTKPDSDAFFGDKSFVIHLANKDRIACANFEKIEESNSNECSPSTVVPVPSPSGVIPSSTPTGTPIATPPPVGAGSALQFSASLMVAGIAAALFAM